VKKLLIAFIAFLIIAPNLVHSRTDDIVFVVPQKPGGGTSVWASIVAEQLEPFLHGTQIQIKHIPGARDIPGFNKWHNKLRFDDNYVMISHGGNGVSFLQENVDYDYRDYELVGLMNLNIIAGKRIGEDMDYPKFSGGAGKVPEAYAMALLICGPLADLQMYVDCFEEHVTWVNGMSGSERRLAFKRGELNGTRENPAAYKKHVEPDENAELWFHHGILDIETGNHSDDLNYPGYQLEELYKERWGVYPSGPFYDAYKLVKSFRDGLQKAIWVNKGNPNAGVLREALKRMSQDPDAMHAIQKKVGNYQWVIGEDDTPWFETLMTFINEPALQTLIMFNKHALGLDSIYKDELVM
jgi:hypothetical protein